MTSTLAPQTADRSADTETRLLVTVRDGVNRTYRPLGFLEDLGDEYRFAYLRRELTRGNFRPLPGLARAVEGPAYSRSLFPVFAERVIAAGRPDRVTSLEALGLSLDAAPFEVLSRSHGQRVGDTIELLPAPNVAPGEGLSFTFLTHGVRYLPLENQARITSLRAGDRLCLRADPENEVNPLAQLVTDQRDVALGWVPDPLLDVIERINDRRLAVERANGTKVGFHFRLLVRVTGQLSKDGGRLFEGPDWAT